jgi:myo-inositol catabolism protein IolS
MMVRAASTTHTQPGALPGIASLRFKQSHLFASRIGFGCAAIGGYDYGAVDDDQSRSAIRAAIDSGINLFDTADVYGLGHSETILSDALGADRKHVIVASKGGVTWDNAGRTSYSLSPDYLRTALEASLTRLRLDCIPLYQLHWPDGVTPLSDAIDTLLRAREQGKIQHIGVCNVPARELLELGLLQYVDTLQLPYSLLERQHDESLQLCAEHSILALCYNVLGQGMLTGKFTRDSKFEGTDLRKRSALFREPNLSRGLLVVEALRDIAARSDAHPSQVAVKWVLDRWPTAIALTGIKNQLQVAENVAAGAVELTVADADRLEKLSNDY